MHFNSLPYYSQYYSELDASASAKHNTAMNKPPYPAVLRALCRRVPGLVKKNGEVNHNELARQSGIPQPTITRQLNGEVDYPRGKTALKLCEFFGVTPDQLSGNQVIPDLFAPGDYDYPFGQDDMAAARSTVKETGRAYRRHQESLFSEAITDLTLDEMSELITTMTDAVSPAGRLRLASVLIESARADLEPGAKR